MFELWICEQMVLARDVWDHTDYSWRVADRCKRATIEQYILWYEL